ncbi:DUF4270 family protein [Mangrovibacterium marinum]|uniref:Uncharacterized protein DUF4270 n=1 Tax=Mangrovibacterium marinum TaxID=1639118 RepID=A0A2T5C3J1_9BACT|nr:DUF4270 family protein [Mangrovibacterium marinum]PTN09350.1 uncharacterized protein DUF4270 [Mangrovibacterium marinum]
MNKFLIFAVIIAFMASCKNDAGSFTIGDDLVHSETTVVMSDSFRIALSTVVLDSVATSNPSTALVGKHSDPLLGTTEMNYYVNFDLSSNISQIVTGGSTTGVKKLDVLDSLTIKLPYSGFSVGDTTQLVTFNIYRLTDELEIPKALSAQYNTYSYPHEENPIGSLTFLPEPSKDSIEIRLDDALAEEIMQMVYDGATEIKSSDDFRTYLKGFVIAPDPSADVILGFDASSDGIQMKLYTYQVNATITEKETNFSVSSENTDFNAAQADREGTNFAMLNNQREAISSTQTGNVTSIQGSTGLYTKVNFPSLNSIYDYGESVLIRAELILVPSLDNDYRDLPSTLNFYETGRRNNLGSALATSTTTGATMAVSATLVSNYVTGEYYYYANISDYLKAELEGNYFDTTNGLLIGLPSTEQTYEASNLFIADGRANGLETKLNLYFLRYDN